MKILILFLGYVAIASAKQYAVLVATTNSWFYYRHQATLCHAYQTLIANGIPKENIITMFYDDIADNPRNPEKGVIRNHPTGPNVYAGIKKDYTGSKVSASTLLAVLSGDSAKAGGPVLKSGPKDNVFLYIVGLGASQALTFPTGPALSNKDFVDALKKLRSNKKAKKVFVNLETTKASTMVEGLLPRKDNILVSTATFSFEYPWAVFCDKKLKICYGSLYGVTWTYFSDRLRSKKFGARATIFDQYNFVRTWNVLTQVQLYGHIEMGRFKLKEFLGYKQDKKKLAQSSIVSELAEAALDNLESDLDRHPEHAEQYEALENFFSSMKEKVVGDSSMLGDKDGLMNEMEIASKLLGNDDQLQKRDMIEETMKQILNKLNLNLASITEPSTILSAEASKNYVRSIDAFSSTCFNINENTYAQTQLGVLAKLCEMGIPLEEQVKAMQEACTEAHRQMKFIH